MEMPSISKSIRIGYWRYPSPSTWIRTGYHAVTNQSVTYWLRMLELLYLSTENALGHLVHYQRRLLSVVSGTKPTYVSVTYLTDLAPNYVTNLSVGTSVCSIIHVCQNVFGFVIIQINVLCWHSDIMKNCNF